VSQRQSQNIGELDYNENEMLLLDEPMFKAPDADYTDMKLLWFYTTTTYMSLSTNAGKEPLIDDILKVKVIEQAFQNPFLMNCVLGLSALQLQHFKQEISPARAIAYRARAFEEYRRAIEEANPDTFPALMACSLLLTALASQMFREEDAKPLYIIDWMTVWRGIGLIFDMVKREALFASGMAMLFYRPTVDLDTSAKHIPNNLLFMVTSIKDDDMDHPYVQEYYDTLKYLGALYMELSHGFTPILDLRIITFFTFLPKLFVEIARQRRPRALVIIAHYLVFAKLVAVWWMLGISDREICNIERLLGRDWSSLLRIPSMAVDLRGKLDIVRLLLNNHQWEPPAEDEQSQDGQTSCSTLVDDEGYEIKFAGDFVYRLTSRDRPKWNYRLPSSSPLSPGSICEGSDSSADGSVSASP
jgi:hypothetical protein